MCDNYFALESNAFLLFRFLFVFLSLFENTFIFIVLTHRKVMRSFALFIDFSFDHLLSMKLLEWTKGK